MSITVNPDFLKEIKRYGAFDINACFNCGNCTAVCPLSDPNGSFPRKLIRLGQLGDKERMISGPEPWLCYYCGECSETCPRQAEPGEYMAAVRRYAIARNEPSGIAGLMYRSGTMAILVTVLVGIVLGAFMLTQNIGRNPSHWIFSDVSYQMIHYVGMGISVLAVLAFLGGVYKISSRLSKYSPSKTDPSKRMVALKRTIAEIVTMSRHRKSTPDSEPGPWYRQSAWIHMGIMFGFLGLLAATALDFIFLELLPLHLSVFWPARIIGTIAGLAMIWGVSAAIVRRLNHVEKNAEHSRLPDWWALIFLFVIGLTGFWLEIAVTFGLNGAVNNWFLLLHVAMAMELVLLFAFTKMAHVIYRPIALYMYYLNQA